MVAANARRKMIPLNFRVTPRLYRQLQDAARVVGLQRHTHVEVAGLMRELLGAGVQQILLKRGEAA